MLLSACVALSEQSEVAAVISAPTDEAQAALHRAVSHALAREDIVLAKDALTSTSLLVIEGNPHRIAASSNAPDSLGPGAFRGRNMQPPNRFRLWIVNGLCVLKHVETQRRWMLDNTRCERLDR